MLKRNRNEPKEESDIVVGCLRVDPPGHRAWINDVEVTLTALEFRLLETLIKRRGRVQTRSGLLEDVWGYSPDVSTRTVDTHIKRLRSKMGDAAEYVENAPGRRLSVHGHDKLGDTIATTLTGPRDREAKPPEARQARAPRPFEGVT